MKIIEEIKKKSDRTYIIIIFIISFIICFSYSYKAYNDNVMTLFNDDLEYYSWTKEIIEKGPLLMDNDYVTAIGLPWLMAIIMKLFGDNWLIFFIFNSIFSAFICVLIFLIGRTVFNRKIGLFAALWSAIYVQFIFYIPTAGKQPLVILLFTCIIYTIIKLFLNPKKNKYLIIISILITYLFHVDERYLLYFPFFCICIFYFFLPNLFIAIKKTGIFFMIIFLLLIPWSIRNYFVHGRIVLLSERTAHITDKIFGYNKQDTFFSKDSYEVQILSPSQIDSVIKGTKTTFSDGTIIHPTQIEAMRDGIIPHRFSRSELYWSVLKSLWKPVDITRDYTTNGYRYDKEWSLKHNLSVGLTYGILLPFMLIGFVGLYYHRKKIFYFFLSILFYHSLFHMLLIPFTRNRYRIPVDPIIILLGIYGIFICFSFVKYKKISFSKIKK